MTQTFLRIGTRGSPLALAQAHETRRRLAQAHGVAEADIAVTVIRTTGDAIQDRALSTAGGKGLFTKEIEEALLSGAIDLAVHSAKDMPTVLPEGLALMAFLEREDARDALISRHGGGLENLPQNGRVGTASLRRQALVRHRRPDIETSLFRGNVQTRLAKLAEGTVDATLLALAGLRRLGLEDKATAILDLDRFPSAVGQGAITLEGRQGDRRIAALLEPINHPATGTALAAERAFLAVLDGSCRTPIAGHAVIAGGELRLHGMILRPDGSQVHETRRAGPVADAVALGRDAGEELRAAGGPGFFASS